MWQSVTFSEREVGIKLVCRHVTWEIGRRYKNIRESARTLQTLRHATFIKLTVFIIINTISIGGVYLTKN